MVFLHSKQNAFKYIKYTLTLQITCVFFALQIK